MSNENASREELPEQRLNAGKDPGPLYRISLLSYGFFFGAIGGHSAKFGDGFTIFASGVMLITLLANFFGYLARRSKPEATTQE